MVAVEENVPDDGNFGGEPAVATARDGAGSVAPGRGLVRADEQVAFDEAICPVQVENIVAGAGEDVVEDLEDGAGPLAAGEVDDVVETGGGAKPVALDDAVTRRRQARAVNQLNAGGAGENGIPNVE